MSSSRPNRVSRNLHSMVLGQIAARGLGFLAMAYLARVLGTDGFGGINFSIALSMYFVLLLNRGLEPYLTRRVASSSGLAVRSIWQYAAIRIPLSIIAYALFVLFVMLSLGDVGLRNIALLFGLEIFIIAFTVEWLYQAIEKMHIIGLSQAIRQALYVALVLLLVHRPADILTVPIVKFLSGGVVAGTLFLITVRKFGPPSRPPGWQVLTVMTRVSLPMSFSFFMAEIYHSFDHVMLGFMKGPSAVGIYSAAYKFVPLATLLPSLVGYAIFPHLARLLRQDQQGLKTEANRYLSVISMCAVFAGGFVAIYSRPLIGLVYGSNYTLSVPVLRMLALVISLAIGSFAVGYPLLAWGRQVQHMRIVASGAASNLVLNALLIPSHGMYGAALATAVSEFLVLALFFRVFYSVVPVGKKPLIAMMASLLGAALMLIPIGSGAAQYGDALLSGLGFGTMLLGMFLVGRLFIWDAIRALLLPTRM